MQQWGLSLLDTAEGVLDIVSDYLQRIRDLTEQAANGYLWYIFNAGNQNRSSTENGRNKSFM